jgi:hypothetical protein
MGRAAAGAAGYRLTFQAKTASVGTVSVFVGQHGPVALESNQVAVAIDGAIPASGLVDMVYDGSAFQVLSPLARNPLERVVMFDGTKSGFTVTNVRPAANQLTVTGHGLTRGTTKNTVPFAAISTAGVIHAGITASQAYYVYVIDANTISLHTAVQGGIDGTTSLLAITADGSGATGTLRYLTNGATRAALGLSHGVCFVTPKDASDGQYSIGFEPAFTSTTSYALIGSLKRATSATAGMVSTDADDVASASQKMVVCTNDATTEIAPTEVNIRAIGT